MDEPRRRLLAWKLGANATRLAALIVVLALGGSAIAVALGIPSADGRIFGCYSTKDGALRVVEEGTSCNKSELAIFWNQVGPAGPKGDTGAQGPTGDTGPAGGGIASLAALNAIPCNTPTGSAGTTRLVVADGNVSIFCDVPRPTGPTVTPAYTIAAVSGFIVTVTFSEPVCRSLLTSPTGDWTVLSNATVVANPVVADSLPLCNAARDNGVASGSLLLASAIPNGAFVGVTLNPFGSPLFGSLSDVDGNLIRAPQTRTATATAPETVRPTLISATTAVGSTTLTLTFSEPVRCSPLLTFNGSDFTITDDDPTTPDPTVTGPGADFCGFGPTTADLSFSIITDGAFVPGRSYTLTLTPEANEIEDIFGNDLESTDRAIVVN